MYDKDYPLVGVSDALNLVTALTRPTFDHFPLGVLAICKLALCVDEAYRNHGHPLSVLTQFNCWSCSVVYHKGVGHGSVHSIVLSC
jgi:hypothetical protein